MCLNAHLFSFIAILKNNNKKIYNILKILIKTVFYFRKSLHSSKNLKILATYKQIFQLFLIFI